MKHFVFVLMGLVLFACTGSTKPGMKKRPFDSFIQVAKTSDKLKAKWDTISLNNYDALPNEPGVQKFVDWNYPLSYGNHLVACYTECLEDSTKGIRHFQRHNGDVWAIVEGKTSIIPCDSIQYEK